MRSDFSVVASPSLSPAVQCDLGTSALSLIIDINGLFPCWKWFSLLSGGQLILPTYSDIVFINEIISAAFVPIGKRQNQDFSARLVTRIGSRLHQRLRRQMAPKYVGM